MKLLNRKAAKKMNLLELSDPERVKLMKAAREHLKQTAIEAKLWQSLVEVENLAVNGNMIRGDKQQLNRFCMENIV